MKLMIIDAERTVMHTFTAFQNTIRQIAEDDTIDDTTIVEQITTTLLTSKAFHCTYMGNVHAQCTCRVIETACTVNFELK